MSKDDWPYKHTPAEAQMIFHDALKACGKAIMEIATDLGDMDDGLTGDDFGDDFYDTVECIQWLENILNLNNDPIPLVSRRFKYTRREWLPAVLDWGTSVGQEWAGDYDNKPLDEDQAFMDPNGEFEAWLRPGAPSCTLYDLVNPKED